MSTAADPLATRPGGRPAVQRSGSLVTMVVTGQLDANAGIELLACLQAEVESAERVDIDLLGVTGSSPEGARSLRRARTMLASRLTEGLHFRTGPGPGQEALLEAFSHEEDDADDGGDPAADA
jgi:hypothetical protein